MAKTEDTKPTKPDLKGFEDKDLDLPPTWEFEEQGDFVYGKFVELRPVTTKDRRGDPRETNVMILEDDGELKGVWETAQLEALFKELQTGDKVYLEFAGKVPLENGNDMNRFICKVKYAK